MNVTKRNGTVEEIDLDKIHKVVDWAAEGLDVSVSQVEIDAQIQFFEGIKTSQIHDTLIRAAADLISEDIPDYQYLAARLVAFAIRKEAYGQFAPPSLAQQLSQGVEKGIYDSGLLAQYTMQDLMDLDRCIDHNRDMDFAYAGIEQMRSKYLVQDRVSGKVYESPQMAIMLLSMAIFSESYKGRQRMRLVKELYDAVSQFDVSLPTPIMSGLRTPVRQLSSCVLIEVGDSLDSIKAGSNAIVDYISRKAGIGLNVGAIRAEGSPIRGGDARHTGVIPFLKLFQAAVKSCSQGGVRGGAATLFYPVWHAEFESLIVLKNNRGVEENRVRQLDYSVQLSGFFYKKLIEGSNIHFFSPHKVPEMYEAFFSDQEKFAELYEKAVADGLSSGHLPAMEVFSKILQERAGTGRIYIHNVDHANTHSPFDPETAAIKQSNLCVAPETKILTDNGYLPISELEGQLVNVWNGEEWSEVTVHKTGENQELVTVVTDLGQEVVCTKYHKFYTQNTYSGEPKEVRASDLKPGDKLIKWDAPVVQGHKTMKDPYINGFYTSDGCLTSQGQRIYLYGQKRLLKHMFKQDGWIVQDNLDREYVHYHTLKDKFFVPSSDYTIDTRLEWFAGVLDGDGSVYRNGTNEQLVLNSIELEYLKEVQLMLNTLGVQAKIRQTDEEGVRLLPANDGTGDQKPYLCKSSYRMLITSIDTQKLLEMGLPLQRLEVTKRTPQRDARQFIRVVEVKDEGRTDDTYCFTEPKRNMGVFNGILAGNCVEISLPTKPITTGGEGEVALCTLAAINLLKVQTPEKMEKAARILIRALDALLSYQDYPLEQALSSTMKYRPLGVGVINYASFLAEKGFKFSGSEGNNATHEIFELMQFHLMKASMELAKEFTPCEAFPTLRLAQGILPIDTYKREVDEVHSAELKCDWEWLRGQIKEYGMRNATVSALMPSETSSIVSNSTNGIEPPRSEVTTKQSKDGMLKQVVPLLGKAEYETYWEMVANGQKGNLEKMGIMQKFICQSISANTGYDPNMYDQHRVPMQQMLEDLILAYRLGLKTLYYHNTRDSIDLTEDDGCSGGACKI